MKSLDEIIERMAYCIGESKGERRDDVSVIFDEMKASLIEYIEGIIGEDEPETLVEELDDGSVIVEVNPGNTLRAEQRAKLKEQK